MYEEIIRGWWAQWPTANVGVVTGTTAGVIVLDVDGPEGIATVESQPAFPLTPRVSTGHGRHYWFRHPGGAVRNFAKRLPGVDLRGDGGFVVAPPSLHASGRSYRWEVAPEPAPLVDAPEWLLTAASPTGQSAASTGTHEALSEGPVLEGSRNDTLHRLGRAMHHKGATHGAIAAALAVENDARCTPPLPASEVEEIAKQAAFQPDRSDFNRAVTRGSMWSGNGTVATADRPRFRLVDDEAMLQEPDQEYLIEDVCSVGALVLMHGQSGAGKSFLGLDAAFSVATGTDWHGHAIKNPGSVVYVAAEGQGGLKNRIAAWKAHRGKLGVLGVHFILEAVDPLNGGDVEALCAQLRARFAGSPPKLVVVDTYAECLAAGVGDENSTKDTGQAVDGWRRIVRGLGATVLIVHHQGLQDQTRGRGSTALKAAAETEIAVAQSKGVVLVSNLKQRDGARFDPFHLRLHVVPLGDGRTSCVLVPVDQEEEPSASKGLKARDEKALAVLLSSEDGLTHANWYRASGLPETTFGRAVSRLVASNLVAKHGDGRGARYLLSEEGRDHCHLHITSTFTSSESESGGQDHHHPPSPPRRGEGGGGEGEDSGGEEPSMHCSEEVRDLQEPAAVERSPGTRRGPRRVMHSDSKSGATRAATRHRGAHQ
jgi:hypothetical protein